MKARTRYFATAAGAVMVAVGHTATADEKSTAPQVPAVSPLASERSEEFEQYAAREFGILDADGSGTIDRAEWDAGTVRIFLLSLDVDSDHQVSRSDLEAVWARAVPTGTKENQEKFVVDMIERFDKSDDQIIDPAEVVEVGELFFDVAGGKDDGKITLAEYMAASLDTPKFVQP